MASARPRSKWASHVALLRGINVGGNNPLPMAELVKLFEAEGGEAVRTYIQSGNVVFAASPKVASRMPKAVSEGIAARFGLQVPVVVRSGVELVKAASGNPFLKSGMDPAVLSVAFLAKAPTARQKAALDPDRSPGDSFELRGRELYLCLPNGAARSRLTNAWMDSTLATTSTVRNWRTVTKLVEMVRER